MRWGTIEIAIDAERVAFVLEGEDGVYAYERGERRCVPAFPTMASVAQFLRDVDRQASIERAGCCDLVALRALAEGRTSEAPEGWLDAWVVLDEIAVATALGNEIEPTYDHAAAFSPDASPDARERARRALRHAIALASNALDIL